MTAALILLAVLGWLFAAVLSLLITSEDRHSHDAVFALKLLAWPICAVAALGGTWVVFATIASGVKFGWTMAG